MPTMTVHNHGTEEGKGLACRESVVNGELKGECMTDDLRTRIVAVQLEHIDRQLTNYDTGREECGCGQQGNATYMEHLADAVIRELDLTQQYLVDGIISDGEPRPWELPCETRYATEWEPFHG